MNKQKMIEEIKKIKDKKLKEEEPITITIQITDTNGHPREREKWSQRTIVMNNPSH